MRRSFKDSPNGFITADLLKLTSLGQLLREDNSVNRFGKFVEIPNCFINNLMTITIKVFNFENLDDVVQSIIIKKRGAQNALFNLNVLRREAVT